MFGGLLALGLVTRVGALDWPEGGLRLYEVAGDLAGYFGVGLTPPSAQAPTIIMTLAIADSVDVQFRKQYFVPFYFYPWAIHYRKSLFEEKGYAIPTTWDEFKTLCGKMDASDPSATTVEAGSPTPTGWRPDSMIWMSNSGTSTTGAATSA